MGFKPNTTALAQRQMAQPQASPQATPQPQRPQQQKPQPMQGPVDDEKRRFAQSVVKGGFLSLGGTGKRNTFLQ